MSEPSASPNRRVPTGQVRGLVVIWASLTVVVGVGTFFGLFWALGGFDSSAEVQKSAPEIVAQDPAAPAEVVVTKVQPTAEPAPTEMPLEPTAMELAPTEVATTSPAVTQAAVVPSEQPTPTLAPTQPPAPTATTAPVVSGSAQFSLGGQVIHGGLLALDKMQV
ncbi:MAG TPA: hypothetical protein QGI62_09690, partial [Anaerolineales bacterium]|nr:hypothetical protein [Anaerolineales bacterium]